MFDSVALFVGAAAAALSSSGLVALIAGVISRFIGQRAGMVESELIQTLGLTVRPPTGDGYGDSEPNDFDPPPGDPSERDSITNVFVNVGNDSESAEALADVVRQHSEAHTRLIIKYYAQGYLQAISTFVASLVFAIAGFGVILWACIYLMQHPTDPEPAGVLGATGLVTQTIGYLFFRRADKARVLMTTLIDKLREDRDREIRFIAGLASAAAIKTPSLRDAVKVATATSLLGVSMPVADLEILANRASEDDKESAPRININAGLMGNGHQPPHNYNEGPPIDSASASQG